MPRLKRRSKKRSAGFTKWHRLQLESGTWFEFTLDDSFGPDRDAIEAGWRQFGPTILKEWIAEKPGTRPWAWWEFDAPELRQRVDGGEHPCNNPERVARLGAEKAKQAYFGCPNILALEDDFAAKWETEAAYLYRLGLLEEGELEALQSQRDEANQQSPQ
ncbi:MAG: hypothetical protein AAGJ46_06630 [Planctomycetota bacterium]